MAGGVSRVGWVLHQHAGLGGYGQTSLGGIEVEGGQNGQKKFWRMNWI